LIGRNRVNLIVGWCGRFLFFVVPRQFSQDICEWLENQILITDWTYFHCPGTTLVLDNGKWTTENGQWKMYLFFLVCLAEEVTLCGTNEKWTM